MKKLKNKNGVTLIALAVTIIIMLILAGVTISMLTGNSGITTNASKAKTKSYLADIKEEYELYLSEKRMEDEYDLDTLYANDKTIRYEGNEVGSGITEICSSIKKGDEKKFEIIKGKIYYVSQDKKVIPIAVELGFSINPYEITDDGVLRSSAMNLYLVDNNGNLDLSEYEGKINVKQRTEQVTGKVETKFYGNENTIEKEISEKLTANKTTNIVSAEMNTTEKIAKQYFTVKSTKKAYIEESEKIEIPEISQVKDLNIETGNTYLKNTKGAKKEVNMYLEKSYINKEELKEVFGEEAKIEIINQDGQKIAEINTSELTENNTENSQVEVKTEGENIVIEYPEGTRKANIKILGEPKKIGEIEIRNTKYFQGDLGITKAEIEKYNYVTSEINITNQETTKIEANTNLVEAEEKIEITMNNNNLGTTNVNKGVEIYATLKTKDYGNVLYKNPEVEIVFPREVKKVTANSIRLVYDEQLTITKAQGYTNEM